MKILAIDTSTFVSGVCIVEDGEVISELNINQARTHSETLLPMVKNALDYSHISLDDIDAFAVGKGPGSFTGLRIGMTVIKTFNEVFNKKLISVSTLEAAANSVMEDCKILALIDARAERSFGARFERKNGQLIRLSEDDLFLSEEIVDFLKNNPNYLICGEINEDLEELIKESDMKINFYNNKILSRLAREIALISEDKFLREEFDEMTLAPNYVRKSQAEESRM